MGGLAFISYRRDDAGQIAQALYLQLKEIFSSGQLFMDVNSIRAGHAWPKSIKSRLDEATVVLALLGPGWLTALDAHGRRRIDDPDDWVRNELLHAIRKGTDIIPVVINHLQNLPDAEGLPDELEPLHLDQAMVLRLDPAQWSADILALSNLLRGEYGLTQKEIGSGHPPAPEFARIPPLDEQQLTAAVATLNGWEVWVDALATEYPRVRRELRKSFNFATFAEAMRFMQTLATHFDAMPHHPRWSNEIGLVTIRLTTFDAGNKITQLDVDAARMVDDVYREWR